METIYQRTASGHLYPRGGQHVCDEVDCPARVEKMEIRAVSDLNLPTKRLKLLILALLSDGLKHNQRYITDTALEIYTRTRGLREEDFKETVRSITGHGGNSLGGFCSVCKEQTEPCQGEGAYS